jgi:thiol-disulfide isomerase/thioredoxin
MQRKKFFLQCAAIFFSLFTMVGTSYSASEPNARDIYGKPYHFSVQQGKWVIINYWATWCQFCVNEIPELNKLAKAIEKMPVEFFAVNYDNASDAEQQSFAQNHQIDYVLLRNNPFARLVARNPISTLPTTFIISPDGRVQELQGQLRSADVIESIR